MDQTPKRIAAKWIEYTLRRNPETGDLKGRNPLEFENEDEGVQDLIELVCSNQSSALAVVDEILNQSSDPWVLVNLGAGPFEDLLSMGKMTHVPAIEALVKKYPHAREVMQHVWMSRFSPEVRAECERIISENL